MVLVQFALSWQAWFPLHSSTSIVCEQTCAPLCFYRDKSSPYEELCKRVGLSSLREQRLAKILSTVFKILASDAGPKSLRDLITVRCSTYNLRGTTILDLPKVKSTTFGLRSWRYAASKLWNALPDESRKIQTFTTFKNYLKTLDLTGL